MKRSFFKKTYIKLKWCNFLGLRYYPTLAKIAIILLVCCIIYPIITYWVTDSTTAGAFGDQYGAINTIISGLVFAAFWASLQLQHRELKLQRQELKRSNKEAEGQTEQFKQQVKLARESQIKDEVYRRITLLRQQKTDIIIHWKERITPNHITEEWRSATGIDATSKYYHNNIYILDWIHRGLSSHAANQIMRKDLYCEAIFVWMRSFFALVDDIILTNKEYPKSKVRYINIVLNSLSSHEKALIFLYHEHFYDRHINALMRYITKYYEHFLLCLPSKNRYTDCIRLFRTVLDLKIGGCTESDMSSYINTLCKK